MAKLHYDKEKLLKDYSATFSLMLKGMAIFLAIIVVYFLIFVFFLGKSHTPHEDFYNDFTSEKQPFGSRIEIDYSGTKLPMYGENE